MEIQPTIEIHITSPYWPILLPRKPCMYTLWQGQSWYNQSKELAAGLYIIHIISYIYIYTNYTVYIYICIVHICIMSILDIFDIRSSEYSRSQYETTSRFASSRISTWEQQNRSVGFGKWSPLNQGFDWRKWNVYRFAANQWPTDKAVF